ncbi:hypothetical protein KSC_000930 [Ktedonobacter sp. SOSP1-52]|nr:hypothetical protein KSC_000930 [Ktedonobacter sp. SOSP1-52]
MFASIAHILLTFQNLLEYHLYIPTNSGMFDLDTVSHTAWSETREEKGMFPGNNDALRIRANKKELNDKEIC